MYYDKARNRIPIREKSVWIRDPQEELREESYPCVTVSSLYDRFDALRWSYNASILGVDKVRNVVIMQEPSQPFDLTYQIDFWARYKEDMNLMTMTWLQGHPRSFNLDVTDDGGEKRSCNVYQDGRIRPMDLFTSKKRLYHTVISYVIWVELDRNEDYTMPMVAEIEAVVKAKE